MPQHRREGGEPSAPATPGLIPLSYTTSWDAALTSGFWVVLSLSPRQLLGPERNAQEAAAASTTLQQALTPLMAVVQERSSQLPLVGSPPQITCPHGVDLAMLDGRGGAAAVVQACSPTRRMPYA